MGSYDNAQMSGFLCRLCSEQNRIVIHLYTDKGRKLKLIEKLKVLPISVEPYDNLPKTFCRDCIDKLNVQCTLAKKFLRSHMIMHQMRSHNGERCPDGCLTNRFCATANETLDDLNEWSSDDDDAGGDANA